MSILIRKTDGPAKKPLSIKIDSELHEQLAELRQRAEKHGFSVDATAICVDALERAVRKATRELDELEGGSAGSNDSDSRSDVDDDRKVFGFAETAEDGKA